LANLDIIKSYLISIGFKVDNSSFNDAESSMNQAGDNIKKFNDKNKQGFSESGDSLKDLFTLFQTSSGTLSRLFPEASGPFKGMIRDITLLRKLYSDFANSTLNKKPTTPTQASPTNEQPKQSQQSTSSNPVSTALSVIPNKNLPDTKNLVDSVLDAKNATKSLESEGGAAVQGFSMTAVASFAAVAAGVVAVAVGVKKLISGIADLAQQDIENEKLSRQLWTTKENAKEVDSALKTLGISMRDLWLSPTLLKQFNQLRQDSASLKLPPEYTQNLKIVQGLGLEFSRLRQLGSLAFQWIGNYILKYAAGPLSDFRQGVQSFNNWLIKNIPNIAKVIGSTLGIVIKTIMAIGEVLGTIISGITTIIGFISSLIPDNLKNITKIVALIGLALMAGPVGAILLLIALIQDVITYFKGGKSVIGGFFDKIGEGMNSIKDGWDYYYNKAAEAFEKIQKKAKEVWDAIKNFFPNLFGKTKGLVVEAGQKVQEFTGNVNSKSAPDYAMSGVTNTSTQTKTNSDNKIDNSYSFQVYGNNPQATATAIASKVSGLNTRNMQGVL
jgi:hypothetical protein